MDAIFGYMEKYDFENFFLSGPGAEFQGRDCHSRYHLGPGNRRLSHVEPYATEMDAIEDALRPARGMTYKYAAAGVNLGGGKAIIIGDPKRKDREPVFRVRHFLPVCPGHLRV